MSPHTILEASIMKKPIVATNVGGIPESVKDKETAFLVEKEDAEELVEKLTFLLSNNEKAQEMSLAGYNFVKKNFTWDIIAKNFAQMIKFYL